MSKINSGGLDQYGTRRFEQQQFGPAGVERVNVWNALKASPADFGTLQIVQTIFKDRCFCCSTLLIRPTFSAPIRVLRARLRYINLNVFYLPH